MKYIYASLIAGLVTAISFLVAAHWSGTGLDTWPFVLVNIFITVFLFCISQNKKDKDD